MARILIVVVFGCFASVASYALLSGKDCNCFGFDLLGARVTLPVDIIVLIAAMFACPKKKGLQQAMHFFTPPLLQLCLPLPVLASRNTENLRLSRLSGWSFFLRTT